MIQALKEDKIDVVRLPKRTEQDHKTESYYVFPGCSIDRVTHCWHSPQGSGLSHRRSIRDIPPELVCWKSVK